MMKKYKLFLVAASLFIALISLGSTTANASYLNGNSYAAEATRRVTTKKSVKVYMVETGKYEAANKFYSYGKIKKGTTLKASYYLMSTGGWIVKSNKYFHDKRTFFIVPGGQHNWYKKAAKKSYKSFHSYRVEAKKLYSSNTFYDKGSHATMSDYRPTQTSKVIFEYGSHVVPTYHKWDWIHGDDVTEYEYNGSWNKVQDY